MKIFKRLSIQFQSAEVLARFFKAMEALQFGGEESPPTPGRCIMAGQDPKHVPMLRDIASHMGGLVDVEDDREWIDEHSWVIVMIRRDRSPTARPFYLCANPTVNDGADDVTESLGHAERFYQVDEVKQQIERIRQLNWTSIYSTRYMTAAAAKKTYGE